MDSTFELFSDSGVFRGNLKVELIKGSFIQNEKKIDYNLKREADPLHPVPCPSTVLINERDQDI